MLLADCYQHTFINGARILLTPYCCFAVAVLLLSQVYDAGSGVLPLPKQSLRAVDQLYERVDAATSGWLRSCRALLDSLSGWQDLMVTHVVVSSSQLVPLLAKLLLARLDAAVPLTHAYSAAAVTKVAAFQRVRAKYGPRARYIAVGGGFEEEAAAGLLSWPFVRVVLGEQAGAAVKPGDAAAGGAAAAGSSKAAAGSPAAAKRQKRVSGQSANARSGSKSSGDDSDGSDADEGEEEEEDAQGGKAAEERHGSPAARSAVRVLPLDALGSRGHTMMELTADKLKGLALSLQ
jgi:hypothetical protein